jgi:hypothetical protein
LLSAYVHCKELPKTVDLHLEIQDRKVNVELNADEKCLKEQRQALKQRKQNGTYLHG